MVRPCTLLPSFATKAIPVHPQAEDTPPCAAQSINRTIIHFFITNLLVKLFIIINLHSYNKEHRAYVRYVKAENNRNTNHGTINKKKGNLHRNNLLLRLAGYPYGSKKKDMLTTAYE